MPWPYLLLFTCGRLSQQTTFALRLGSWSPRRPTEALMLAGRWLPTEAWQNQAVDRSLSTEISLPSERAGQPSLMRRSQAYPPGCIVAGCVFVGIEDLLGCSYADVAPHDVVIVAWSDIAPSSCIER